MSKSFNSFAELGAALGVEQKPVVPVATTRKCFKCGGEMQNVPGTNIFRCVSKLKNGKPCLNFTLAKAS